MKLRITIGGNTYEADVEVLQEEEVLPLDPVPVYGTALNSRDPAGDGAGEIVDKICRSPVNGMVIRVHAREGQVVEAGQVLVLLESMKMETRVTAPCAGKVDKVHVTPGHSVKAEEALVELA